MARTEDQVEKQAEEPRPRLRRLLGDERMAAAAGRLPAGPAAPVAGADAPAAESAAGRRRASAEPDRARPGHRRLQRRHRVAAAPGRDQATPALATARPSDRPPPPHPRLRPTVEPTSWPCSTFPKWPRRGGGRPGRGRRGRRPAGVAGGRALAGLGLGARRRQPPDPGRHRRPRRAGGGDGGLHLAVLLLDDAPPRRVRHPGLRLRHLRPGPVAAEQVQEPVRHGHGPPAVRRPHVVHPAAPGPGLLDLPVGQGPAVLPGRRPRVGGGADLPAGPGEAAGRAPGRGHGARLPAPPGGGLRQPRAVPPRRVRDTTRDVRPVVHGAEAVGGVPPVRGVEPCW